MFNDTIAAISTSTLSAAGISVIRLSGEDAFEVLNRIFRCSAKEYEGYRIYYGHIFDPETGKDVDEVLVSIFRAPRSFTGENMAEISCHGGLYVTRKILTLCLSYGARQAVNGEYTRRAYLNGRIDLTQAEAVNDLIMADNQDNAALAVNSLAGSIRKLLTPLIDGVAQIMAHIEVNIDYPEYDDNGIITAAEIEPVVDEWLISCDKILNLARSSMIVKEGVRTVIVGKPNVGKSSLLNALLQQDKAIISAEAGTTRDLVEGDIHLENVTLHLIDTAGIHQTANAIEQMGIEKSRQALSQAQLVIVVLDGSAPLDEEDRMILRETENASRIVVYNKNDLSDNQYELSICAARGEIQPLIDEINRMFAQDRVVLSQPVLTNERQIALMQQAKDAMKSVKSALRDQVPLDLMEEDIQLAYRCLKEILGEFSREDLLDEIFGRFCVGK
ncbi:MAG: tRNA uridine-5-carboxymethylaminomethyl(34) synthesis GTPase MnmE [Erysipelotrichaceae bacterium]|nr:tRNA uridine-5-carboxymethylaminomethyl(34) synthesis GTPase MnmE [Erysipelotrichaceae bacterium]